jgi:hypothetical protein
MHMDDCVMCEGGIKLSGATDAIIFSIAIDFQFLISMFCGWSK